MMSSDNFVVLGLAHCFTRSQDNQLTPIQVVEPIPSSTLESLFLDIPSSYSLIRAFTVQQICDDQGHCVVPEGFPDEVQLAPNFHERLLAAARTYDHNPQAKDRLPLNQSKVIECSNPPQRILNATHQVKDSDNVKQHPLTHTTL
ncbi:hypothetical protein [Lyngbya confervoides]|uniref:Uncharacterized protein n=1 Tax=Lyngbya confervoides BDU141951 TaxID=1574623 RepID=A0ABD4T275_9CYAN|nr:hypothetical protein [Lyngbya confervoides]MCM1982347.1 hypothetical protein [Lyngbya confervoides BDU141951]